MQRAPCRGLDGLAFRFLWKGGGVCYCVRERQREREESEFVLRLDRAAFP